MQVDQEEQQKTEEQQQVQPENKAELEEMEVIWTSEISFSLQDTSGRFMRICSVWAYLLPLSLLCKRNFDLNILVVCIVTRALEIHKRRG